MPQAFASDAGVEARRQVPVLKLVPRLSCPSPYCHRPRAARYMERLFRESALKQARSPIPFRAGHRIFWSAGESPTKGF